MNQRFAAWKPVDPPGRAEGNGTIMATNFGQGLWRLADPKISLASMASLFLGACASAAKGPLHWGWLGLTVLGIFCIEVAKNASGEIFDFDSGTDPAVAPEHRTPFSGGKRVLVDELLTRRQTIGIAAVAYLLGIGIGLVIVVYREPLVLQLGMIGVGAAYFYNGYPLKLAYRGMGELTVAFCYGPLICSGTYLVQHGTVTPQVVALSLPLGLLIAAFLWINEFPDVHADRQANKKNWVVRLGPRQASRVFVIILATAGILLAELPLMMGYPKSVWFAGIAIPPAVQAARRLWVDYDHPQKLIPAQASTLLAFVLFALGGGIGLVIAN
jgi:1,4-dihydroxy-2-naphthoate octaprenyltransferase